MLLRPPQVCRPTKRRILSDAFIDRQIAKIDEIFERNQTIRDTPYCLRGEGESAFSYSPTKLSQHDRESIREYYKQFQDLSYVRGFWLGWSLREGVPAKPEPNSVQLESEWKPFEKFDFTKVGQYLLRYKDPTYKNCVSIIRIGEQTKEHGWFFHNGMSVNKSNFKLDSSEYAGPLNFA